MTYCKDIKGDIKKGNAKLLPPYRRSDQTENVIQCDRGFIWNTALKISEENLTISCKNSSKGQFLWLVDGEPIDETHYKLEALCVGMNFYTLF